MNNFCWHVLWFASIQLVKPTSFNHSFFFQDVWWNASEHPNLFHHMNNQITSYCIPCLVLKTHIYCINGIVIWWDFNCSWLNHVKILMFPHQTSICLDQTTYVFHGKTNIVLGKAHGKTVIFHGKTVIFGVFSTPRWGGLRQRRPGSSPWRATRGAAKP